MKADFLGINNMQKACPAYITVLMLALMVSTILCGCFCPDSAESREEENTNSTSMASEKLDLLHYNDGRLVENGENYAIAELDGLYYCFFYNSTNNRLIKVDCSFSKIPKITTVNSHVLKLTANAGASNATRFGYYVDTENGLISEIFRYIWDEANNLVAYVETDSDTGKLQIIVRDIFDNDGFRQEINTFEASFSKTVEPFSKIVFSNDGEALEVTYFSGEQYMEITETFPLVG